MDGHIGGAPSAKHTPYYRYERFLKRYFEFFTDGPMETMCLFREPVDWLHSWWRYRGRDDVADPSKSTRDLSFDTFVRMYIDGAGGPAKLGRPARFVSNHDDAVSVDHIFRYDHLGKCVAFLQDRLKRRIELDRLNVSPPPRSPQGLHPSTLSALRQKMDREFEIYESIAR